MQGLLDFIKTPEGQGLLSGVFGYAANARRGTPINNLGRGGLAGVLGYSNAIDREQQAQESKWLQQYRGLQMDQMQSQIEKEKREEAERQRVQGVINQTLGGITPQQAIGADASGPTQAKADMIGQRPKLDANFLLSQGVPFASVKQIFDAQNLGRPEVKNIETVSINGKPMRVGIDQYGQQVAQIGMEWKPMERVDEGSYIGVYDPTNPTGGVTKLLDKTQSPDNKASNAVAWANHSLAKKRLDFDQGQASADAGGPGQAGLVKAFGKAPAGFRWKADGSMEFIPGGPADQKAQQQKSGEGTVGTVVADLRDRYRKLKEGGGIVESGGSVLGSVGAYIGSSDLGQAVGGAVGTKNQGERDSIAMTRPVLLQAIMKATGMSAKQMDSNAELKLYLATATDPTKGYQANMAALDRIEEMFAGGSGNSGLGGASGQWGNAAQPTGKTVVRTGTYGGRKVIQYSDGSTEYAN